eukprot:gene1034-1371_t
MSSSDDKIMELSYSNWGVWRRKFKGHLQSKDLVDALTDAASKNSGKAQGLMTRWVGIEFLHVVSEAESAKAAWEALQLIFAQQSAARYSQLQQQYHSLEQLPGETISAYTARLATTIYDITEAVGQVDSRDHITRLLEGLRPEFATISSIILNEEPLPDLHKVTAKLLIEEMKVVPKHNRDAAFFGHSKKGFGNHWKQQRGRSNRSSSRDRDRGRQHSKERYSRDRAGDRQHSRDRYSNRDRASSADRSSKSSARCWICGKKGHKKHECWHNKDQHDRQDPPRGEVAFVSSAYTASSQYSFEPDEWIIDTGAGRHSTGDQGLFYELQRLEKPRIIQYGDGNELEARHEGKIRLHQGDNVHLGVTLTGVLYVPGQGVNLLSVRQISKHGGGLQISEQDGSCSITHNGQLVITASTHESGLWAVRNCSYANLPRNKDPILAAIEQLTREKAERWHRRYGHLSYRSLAKMAGSNLVDGMDVSPAAFLEAAKQPCEQCQQSRQTRQPFKSTGHSSSKVLELLHSDLCGPISPPTLEGERYVITLQDDYSGLSMVQLLKSKSDATASMKHMITRLECQTEQEVKQIRTDNGTEYVNDALTAYFSSKGIIQQHTMPFSPEQNGAAERVNRTLMERARAMLIESGMQQELWGEAVLTANFLRNRAASSGREATPYELFTGNKPDVSSLRPFGSTAYVHVPKEKRSGKLAARSETGRMVGYLSEGTGYRIYMPDDGRFVHSRNVQFQEDVPAQPNSDSSASAADNSNSKHVTFDCSDSDDDEMLPALEEAHDQPSDDSDSDDDESPAGGAAGARGAAAAAATSTGRPLRATRGQSNRYADYAMTAADFSNSIPEPRSYTEALDSAHNEQWQQAMDDEYNSLMELGTWTLEKTPPGITPIPVKWVYKVKRDGSGRLQRFKARLVAKGFRQQEGIDYNEVYAPVSKYSTFRTLMAMAAEEDLEVHQLDIKTAFLQGELAEQVYIEQPQGYEEGGRDMCCRLNKAIYGLKQAPRTWHTRLSQELELMGSTASEADPGLYVRHDKRESTFLLCYVDDILVVSKQLSTVTSTKQRLMAAFDARDLGEAVTYLGINIYRDHYAGDIDTRRSTTGYVFMYNGGAVSWQSKRQPTVAVSTAEAEYMAAAAAVKEGLWLSKLLTDLGKPTAVIEILADNQSAIKLLRNPISSFRSKHIDVIHHFARERVMRGEVKFSYISTANQLADVLTKALPTAKHSQCRAGMGVQQIQKD